MKCVIWQEQHPTVHGGADSWARDTGDALLLRGHEVADLRGGEIESIVYHFKPDVIIIGTIHCFAGLKHAEYLLKNRIPAVWMLHDYWPWCGPRMLMQSQNGYNASDLPCEAVEGVCANSCGHQYAIGSDALKLVNCFYVVTGCDGAGRIMQRNGVKVRAVLEEGVYTDLWKPGIKRQDSPAVVYASAQAKDLWKGVHILEQAIEGTELELRFLTGLSRGEVAEQLSGATLYAFPSVYQEIWGLTLTEAMASGCAVVAADVAGARAQVHEGTGVLVPPHDPIALRDALLELAANPKRAVEMGEAARAHVVADHGLATLGLRWEHLLEKVQGRSL